MHVFSDICTLTAAELAGLTRTRPINFMEDLVLESSSLPWIKVSPSLGKLRSMKAISERGEYAANLDVALVARFQS